jgi:hypothetical protein
MYSQLFQFEGNLANSGDAGFGNLEVVDTLPGFTSTPQGQGVQLGSILRFPQISMPHMLFAGSFGFKVRVNTGSTQGVLFACDYDDGQGDQMPVWAWALVIGATPSLRVHTWTPNRQNRIENILNLPSYDTWHEVTQVCQTSGSIRFYIDGEWNGSNSSWYSSQGYWQRPYGYYDTKFGLSDFGAGGPNNNLPVATTCTGVDVDWLFSSDDNEGNLYQNNATTIPTGDRPLNVGVTNTLMPSSLAILTSTSATETSNAYLSTMANQLYGPPMTSGGGGPTESRREFWS